MKTDLLQSFVEKVGVVKAEELFATVRCRPVAESGIACASLSLLPADKCSIGNFMSKTLKKVFGKLECMRIQNFFSSCKCSDRICT